MDRKEPKASLVRRLFLARLGAGAGVVAASAVASPANAGAATKWKPFRHTRDDWLDKISGEHRFVFDSTTAAGIASALQFATNYFSANADAYGLKASDLAVVVIARHNSTAFAYNDAMWAKYGKYFSELAEFTDPKTKEPPTSNVYLNGGNGSTQPGLIDGLINKGAHFAVCEMATRFFAGKIARATGTEADSIVKEIGANLVGNAHLVSAGIVTVNRAQERGYSFVYSI